MTRKSKKLRKIAYPAKGHDNRKAVQGKGNWKPPFMRGGVVGVYLGSSWGRRNEERFISALRGNHSRKY